MISVDPWRSISCRPVRSEAELADVDDARAIAFATLGETESEWDQNGVVDDADLGLFIDARAICFRGLTRVAEPTGR